MCCSSRHVVAFESFLFKYFLNKLLVDVCFPECLLCECEEAHWFFITFLPVSQFVLFRYYKKSFSYF